jgi:hypothetical protein
MERRVCGSAGGAQKLDADMETQLWLSKALRGGVHSVPRPAALPA